MSFQIDDQVVHPAHGLGRIVGLETKRSFGAEPLLCYEVAIRRGTIWVPAGADTSSVLRLLTSKTELGRYRSVLRSRPASLTPDHRKRRMDLVSRLKGGLFQNLCEVVRDLTARRWLKPLNEMDSVTLRKTREDLCQEWAAANEVSVLDAAKEVDALLLEGQHAYQH
jgi:CarD family transcriptional regulator